MKNDSLDDYSNTDIIEYIYTDDEEDIFISKKSKNLPIDKSSVNLQVGENNKVIVSLNINDDIISILNNTKYKDSLKIEFELSKEFYMSLINHFK
jgi:hypothetical protein